MGVVPIVNENDTISVSVRIFLFPDPLFSVDLIASKNVQEIKFGDNDTLSAITSSMVPADYLFLLTDVDGLYLSNPPGRQVSGSCVVRSRSSVGR